ncbi:S8 family serine peptidase, partial [Camelliibacillus cellulosilyticus]
MRVKKRQALKFLSFLMIACLLIPFNFSKAFAAAGKTDAANEKVQTALHKAGATSGKATVSSKLKDQFSKDKYVTYLLKFRDQADTKKAAAQAQKLSKKDKLSAAKAKYAERSAVVNALRAKAMETQPEVTKYLEKEKKAGHVKNYHTYYIVNAISVTGTKEVMDKLASFPEIEKILPNETRHLLPTVNVKDLKSSVLTKEKAQAADKAKTEAKTNGKTADNGDIAWGVERVGAPAVWNMGYDGTGVVIGSLDSGVQWNHPALKEKYRGYNPNNPDQPDNEYNWFDAIDGQSTPYDDMGHGSHTVGTMVGAEPDGSHQVGMAPGAKWIAAKAFSAAGTGSDDDILAAGEWLLAPKDANGNPHTEKAPDIINNSWGGGPGLDEWFRPMVQNWRAAGIFPEFSAGNTDIFNPGGPGSVAAPANYPESFATGATDSNDNLASFSLQGPSPYDEIKPEISAPGVNICSSVPNNQYDCTYSGTSMAGPHVSGAIALMLSADASLSVDDIEQVLMDTATPRTDAQFPNTPNNGYGHGILDAFSAVSAVTQGLGTVQGAVTTEGDDNEAPTFQHTATTEAYAGKEIVLQVSAQDNVSVSKVELQYKGANDSDWKTVQAQRIDGNYKSGVWQASIPGNAVAQPSISYKWHIVDFGNNDVNSDVYNVTVHDRATVGYFTDFESSPVGWLSYGNNNSWEWGVPTSGPGHAASGDKVYATNLDGNYDNNTEAYLEMPPIHLPDGPSYLQFKQWYETEKYESGTVYDWGNVYISTDEENWVNLAQYDGTSNGWEDAEVDLSNYAGQDVYIAFHFHSDGSVPKLGWYIDDVALTDQSANGASKAHLGIMPKPGKKASKDADQSANKTKADKRAKKDNKAGDTSKIKSILKNPKPPVSMTVKKGKTDAKVSNLPLGATVNVLESGRSVKTNPADGSYSFTHAAGQYTLQADAYGYQSATQSVDIPRDGSVTANFTLEAIPQGTITGTVTNKATGEPVANATLMLMEDANIQPVHTDANGHYSITAYEGTYTLHVSAPNFYADDVQVTVNGNDSTEKNIELKPFVGYPGEIAYDDGTAENAHSFYDAGNAWGVKMELPKGHDHALITGGKFRFWD